ncbi:homocysteine methyltransferase [Liquorilactobacillus aquaticus DSM 21051]|uniref:S-methylmethionine:homocysteine methyltransferase n=1 Tax=Liquorilactobacillus aquaticus DSM 21051 TaxID=1423725 RepID=A0A0R2D9E4_9LACO|nr:homocysteine S-methyltransferase [Liquorilactobacillus aquaticus]KRM97254.1 homocysteine methyltransferase [Liquorilactobacillus aquaticus DSM 21051]
MNIIARNLKNKPVLVVDGAMATELEKKGINTVNDLWSANALINAPEKVTAVHRSYFEAGADIAITNTYQANVVAFEKRGLSHSQSEDLVVQAVRCAQEARADFYKTLTSQQRSLRELLVAGSVGPYGAYLADGSEYTGRYSLTEEEYQSFHYSRLSLLNKAGVDLFAIETQPNFAESKALVDLVVEKFPKKSAWLSFSIKDSSHLCDGTSLKEAIKYFEKYEQVAAIGINCIALEKVEAAIKNIKKETNKPIIVYPNNGDRYDPQTKTWRTNPNSATFSELVPVWKAAGARLIGGCCRSNPDDIKEIADAIKD